MNARVLFYTPPKTEMIRPAMSPEMTAAVIARNSRNGDGLDAILEKVRDLMAGGDERAAVDGIFDMADYGHRSIFETIPVAVQVEGISHFLTTMIWSLVTIGGGQETSTRYNTMAGGEMFYGGGSKFTTDCAEATAQALEMWRSVQDSPKALQLLGGATGAKLARLQRNFIFDRARYWIPASALTNAAFVTWSTEWMRIIKLLDAAPWQEFQDLADKLRDELFIVAPRCIKHTQADENAAAFWQDQILSWQEAASSELWRYTPGWSVEVKAVVNAPRHLDERPRLRRLNRYDQFDAGVRIAPVNYQWQGVALAEMRDMNRHRPGSRVISWRPVGFYGADDQAEEYDLTDQLKPLRDLGETFSNTALNLLTDNEVGGVKEFPYRCLFGSQMGFSHTSTLDKLLYEIELRTGPGTHYRYRQHYLQLLEEIKKQIPNLPPLLLGTGEPE